MTPAEDLILSLLGRGPATLRMIAGQCIAHGRDLGRAEILAALDGLKVKGLADEIVTADGTRLYRVGRAIEVEVEDRE